MILDSTNQKLTKVVVAQTFLNVASEMTKFFEKLRIVACQNTPSFGTKMAHNSGRDVETSITCAVNEHSKNTRGISESRNQKVDWRFRNKRLAFLGC
jgi:hypothetical protein